MQPTPASLLERLRQPGDEAAWDRFVELYSPLLHRWVRHCGVAEPDATDIVQEVFLLLLHELPRFAYDPARTFRGWLWTVTRNRLREILRSRRHAPSGERVPEEQLPDPVDGDPLADEEYRAYLVRRAMALMQSDFEPRTWRACVSSIVDGKTAAELGMSEGALRAARFRVLSRLRRELAGLWE